MAARRFLALAGSVLLAGGLLGGMAAPSQAASAPTGDVGAASMTRAQARAAYLDLACPLNASLMTLSRAEENGTWPELRRAVRAVATQQLRAAGLLDHPQRPWPADVRVPVTAIADMDTLGAGQMTVLSLAGSVEAYHTQIDLIQNTALPGDEVFVAGIKAVKLVRARLGLPQTGGCPPL